MNPPDPKQVLTPTALNRLVRQLLDDAMPMVWVEGELSNVARPGSGHVYFTLKDAGAQVRCAMFRPRASLLRFRPADGQLVRLRGRVGLYEPRGDYQLIADHMEDAGEGALQRAFAALKERLAAEGLFASDRKRALPPFPRRLAVITSPTGAAIRDVLTVIARRFPLLPVDILPSPVQGAEAVPMLRERLRTAIASDRYDVILITRGGGSLEDLWAFNDEQLARDIAASPVPVVAAIGHEVDVTLAELAADLRAPTPSAAAEAITPDRVELIARLSLTGRRLRRDNDRALQRLGQRLDSARLRLNVVDPRRRLVAMRDRAGQIRLRLRHAFARSLDHRLVRLSAVRVALRTHDPSRHIQSLANRLETLRSALVLGERRQQTQRQALLRETARALHALSPLRTLDRGYAILRDRRDGAVLTTVAAVQRAERVTAKLADGEVRLEVDGP